MANWIKTLPTAAVLFWISAQAASAQDSGFTYTLSPPAWQQVSRDAYMSMWIFESARNANLQEIRQRNQRDADRENDGQTRPETNSDTKPSPTVSLPTVSLNVPAASGQSPSLPRKMAAHYPAKTQAEAERIFREMLDKHPQLMRTLGVPENDIAAGVATFIAGSYMAYRNEDFPDQNFKPLYEQMRVIVAENPMFMKASNVEKREFFEQMAILGTFMALTQQALKEQPNAKVQANLRQAARGYLQEFLKTDADRVQVDANGLTLN